MPVPPSCRSSAFFALRTPGLPLDALGARDRSAGEAAGPAREAFRRTLQDLIRHPPVREAIALASPDLAARLDAWSEGALDAKAAQGVERALVKYLGRMSSRATPFGLFAGLSMGSWGPASHLTVAPWSACRKAVRLDGELLEAVVDRLAQAPEIRGVLRYRPNTSLYPAGGWYRYLERRGGPGEGRSYHLEAVEATPHLAFVLREAGDGARLDELAGGLVRHLAVTRDEARAYLDQLVEAQVLCADLAPPLTCPDPLDHLIRTLQAEPASAPAAGSLARLAEARTVLEAAPLGAYPGGYPSPAASLQDLGVPAGTRDPLQVDLFRPAPGLTLSLGVRRALEEGAETLRRLAAPLEEGPLDRFRAAFEARYGERWVPLLEALDEERGLGFDGSPPREGDLLADLPFPVPAPARSLSRREHYLLGQIPRWQGVPAWDLSEADLEALALPDPPPFPHSFAALATLAAADSEALDRGEFQFWMEQYSGPTAARWLGRFASGDPALAAALRDLLREEAARRPEAVFAEVVHVPEGRMGNVLARPLLREHEIPFLAAPGVPADHTFAPADLQLTVRGGRIRLASRRTGQEVVPRLSSAHNFARGPAVYRFLAHLQDQDGRGGGWSWGALSDLPFLPRVTRGRHVLSKARWRIEARELKEALAAASGEGEWGAFRILRQRRGLPRQVVLTQADHQLVVDLEQPLWAETLAHLVARRPFFLLAECFPGPDQAPVASPEGRLAHELVIPFESDAPIRPAPLRRPPEASERAVRTFPPGSEWLYLKVYGGPVGLDGLLGDLAPFLQRTEAEGLWDRWHFVRYRDPDLHLRVRFHGDPARLLGELLPRVHAFLEAPLAEGRIWRVQVDTFEPELERYGGALGFDLAEAWFHEDSRRVLAELADGMPATSRWKAGLCRVDAIWSALGLDLVARRDLARASRESFRREFGDTGEGAVRIGHRFRAFRRDLEAEFPAGSEAASPGPDPLLRLRAAAEGGLLEEDLPRLAGSLAHMHLNRLLRDNPRETEWVLMEFLTRLYDTRLARAPARALPG